MAFQVGDRVELLPEQQGASVISSLGGTVRIIEPPSRWSVGVQFKGLTGGHDLDGLLSGDEAKEGWWCDPVELRQVQPPHPQPPGGPRFTVGDLVDMGNFSGGKVIGVDAEPRYSVQWPDGHIQRIKESTLRRHVAPSVVTVRESPGGTGLPKGGTTMHPFEVGDHYFTVGDAPPFKVGDHFTSLADDGSTWEVRTGPFDDDRYVGRVVSGVRLRLFHVSAMERHPPPARCAPDGTRCEQYDLQPAGVPDWRFCPMCGGRLLSECPWVSPVP